jgi:hypothetical protein
MWRIVLVQWSFKSCAQCFGCRQNSISVWNVSDFAPYISPDRQTMTSLEILSFRRCMQSTSRSFSSEKKFTDSKALTWSRFNLITVLMRFPFAWLESCKLSKTVQDERKNYFCIPKETIPNVKRKPKTCALICRPYANLSYRIMYLWLLDFQMFTL